MKTNALLLLCISMVLVGQVGAEEISPYFNIDGNNDEYCHYLAKKGVLAYYLKHTVLTLDEIVGSVSKGLEHDKTKQTAVIGVVYAIYGDDSIHSEIDAFEAVYYACI